MDTVIRLRPFALGMLSVVMVRGAGSESSYRSRCGFVLEIPLGALWISLRSLISVSLYGWYICMLG